MAMEISPKIGCVVMAAGSATRFGANKLAAELHGKSLIARALDAVPSELFCEIVVVTQYSEVESLALAHGFSCLRNERPELGISHTVRLGTRHLRRCDAVLYMVSDQPLLSETSIARVVDAWKRRPSQIVSAAHDDRRGNPCLFPRAFFEELCALTGDHGGSSIIRAHPASVTLVEIPGDEMTDVDTPLVLRELNHE